MKIILMHLLRLIVVRKIHPAVCFLVLNLTGCYYGGGGGISSPLPFLLPSVLQTNLSSFAAGPPGLEMLELMRH